MYPHRWLIVAAALLVSGVLLALIAAPTWPILIGLGFGVALRDVSPR